jgi:hypothetical protein
MVSYIGNGLLYFGGLFLLTMPPRSIPYFDGDIPYIRLTKHALGLGLFMVGTMEIHGIVKKWAGFGFVLSSCGLILTIVGLRIYVEKSE